MRAGSWYFDMTRVHAVAELTGNLADQETNLVPIVKNSPTRAGAAGYARAVEKKLGEIGYTGK